MLRSITTQIIKVSSLSVKLFIVVSGAKGSNNRFTPKVIRVWDNNITHEQSMTFSHTSYLQFDYNGFNPSEYDKSKRFIIPSYQGIKLAYLLKKILRALENNNVFTYEDDELKLYESDINDNTFVEYGFHGNLAVKVRPIIYQGRDDIEYEAVQLIISDTGYGIILTPDEVLYLMHVLEATDFVTLSNTIINNAMLMYSGLNKNIDYSYSSRNEQRSAEDIYRIENNSQDNYKVPEVLRKDNILNQLIE